MCVINHALRQFITSNVQLTRLTGLSEWLFGEAGENVAQRDCNKPLHLAVQ